VAIRSIYGTTIATRLQAPDAALELEIASNPNPCPRASDQTKEMATMAGRKTMETPEKQIDKQPVSKSKKVPAAKKAKPRAKPAPKTKAPPAGAHRATLLIIGEQQKQSMIAEAAYYRAVKRGQGPGDPLQDWLEAEAEIAQMLESQLYE
jgi:hypothetical protein